MALHIPSGVAKQQRGWEGSHSGPQESRFQQFHKTKLKVKLHDLTENVFVFVNQFINKHKFKPEHF